MNTVQKSVVEHLGEPDPQFLFVRLKNKVASLQEGQTITTETMQSHTM